MKPDVSRVKGAVEAHVIDHLVNGPAEHRTLMDGAMTAAEQACIAYAITVVEGIFHSSLRCENYAPEYGGGPCDRCTTLAQLRAEKEKP